MVRLGECPACRYGNHKKHVRNYQPVPEGMIGGAICTCEGECRTNDSPQKREMRKIRNLMNRAKKNES